MSVAGSKPEGGPDPQPGGPRRVLVLSTEPLTGDEVRERIAADVDAGGGEVELDFVVPALIGSALELICCGTLQVAPQSTERDR